jgi:hypothetical protein
MDARSGEAPVWRSQSDDWFAMDGINGVYAKLFKLCAKPLRCEKY